MKRNLLVLGIAVLSVAGAVLAQNPPAKTQAKKSAQNGAAAARGKEIFTKKCAVCHYADSDAKKIGPGLKGLSKRGTFSINGNKITDETLKAWILNGDTLMPPFQ
ncbi:MAG: c-type cytochrome, partial [Candidatus Acidiferrum sp.]